MLILVGDVNLTDGYFDVGFGIGSKLQKNYDPFATLKRDKGDLWIGNFEGVTAEVSNKKGTAAKQFRVRPDSLKHLKHLDVYCVANNHAMQHGAEAFVQTVEALEGNGSKCFGLNDRPSAVFEHQGRTISITGFSQRIDSWSNAPAYWYNPEYQEIEEEIELLPKDAFKIVYVHWGNEFINYPSSQQKRFAHWLIDNGVDLVVGMHPHVLQGFEVYKEKYIFYSIGNFVFDMAWEPTHFGAMIRVDFSGNDVSVSTSYIKICEDYSPVVVSEKEVPKQYRFEFLNDLILNEENSEEYHTAINRFYKKYRKANHKDIIRKISKHPTVAMGIINDYLKRRLKYVSSNNE